MQNNRLAINSTLILITTTLLGTILHELAHYVTALYFKLEPKLFHNYVSYRIVDVPEFQKTIVAAAGPLFSLFIGIFSLYISFICNNKKLLKLFFLWMGMNSIVMFLGYLLIAPFAKNGDTGKVFTYFNIPTYISLTIAIISFILIIKVFSKLSNQFIYYKSHSEFNQEENANNYLLFRFYYQLY